MVFIRTNKLSAVETNLFSGCLKTWRVCHQRKHRKMAGILHHLAAAGGKFRDFGKF
ncbi:hypothetical protein [Stenoxybacter acetivorans]|uniref:hypothetical protein n=1 Tax=Stenoxybacter acetivorans TaxID=422441 RepID=UPI0012EC8BA9|nr:hypothetical protein [Stenoxybacter acetivorans]